MTQTITERNAEIGELVIAHAKEQSRIYASTYADNGYYSFLSGQLQAIIQGMVLDMDDKGIERLKRLYVEENVNDF